MLRRRRNLEKIVKYCHYIWIHIDHLINIYPSNDSDKSRYQASKELTAVAIQMACSFATRKYTCLEENDITRSRSIVRILTSYILMNC